MSAFHLFRPARSALDVFAYIKRVLLTWTKTDLHFKTHNANSWRFLPMRQLCLWKWEIRCANKLYSTCVWYVNSMTTKISWTQSWLWPNYCVFQEIIVICTYNLFTIILPHSLRLIQSLLSKLVSIRIRIASYKISDKTQRHAFL